MAVTRPVYRMTLVQVGPDQWRAHHPSVIGWGVVDTLDELVERSGARAYLAHVLRVDPMSFDLVLCDGAGTPLAWQRVSRDTVGHP